MRPPKRCGEADIVGSTRGEVEQHGRSLTTRRTPAVWALWVIAGASCTWPFGQPDTEAGRTDPNPPVRVIEVVPDRADVRIRSVFEVQLRLRDMSGRIILGPVDAEPQWVFSPDDGTLTSIAWDPEHQTAVLKVGDNLPDGERRIDATAEIAGVEGTAVFRVLKEADVPDDRILADHMAAHPLEAALVTGKWDECAYDVVFTFSNIAPLGKVTEGSDCEKPGQVAVFGANRAVGYTGDDAQIWRPDADIVNASSRQMPSRVDLPPLDRTLQRLAVWIALDPEETGADMAAEDVRTAAEIYWSNRIGVDLKSVDGGILGHVHVPGNPCIEAEEAFREIEGPDFDDDAVINVFYVSGGAWRGTHCRKPAQKSDLIFIYAKRWSPTTLAHELGHALALRTGAVALRGHTHDADGYIRGFQSANVMWGGEDDETAATRSHFSLGQAFRMSIDEESRVNRRPGQSGPTLDCQVDSDQSMPCPRLCLDISPSMKPEVEGSQCELVEN